jgi:hypothetical protein
MNTQNPIVRRLLPLALACGLLAAVAPAVQAQEDSSPSGHAAPSATLKGCGYLNVTFTGTKAKVAKVTCEHGFFYRTVPPSGEISPDQPAVVTVYQSGSYGPDCIITLSGDKETAVVSVQQNFCGLAAGEVTAKVVSGNARHVRTVKGAYRNTPGMVFFSLAF